MSWTERVLVIATLCVLTGIGWRMGAAAPGAEATSTMVSIRSGSVSRGAPSGTSSSRTHIRRTHVGGGFHGGK